MKQPHPTQLAILKKLLFAPALKYSDAKPSHEMENNTFDFHLNQLIQAKYIIKENNIYKLTNEGKEYANRMDTDKTVITKQAKVSLLIFCYKIIENQTYIMIFTRLKQPFYGCQGMPSGKVMYGESITEAATRELYEETKLVGEPNIAKVRHYLVKDKTTGELLEDKIMFSCIFKDPTGEIVAGDEGKYEWVEVQDLDAYIQKPFEAWWKEDFAELLNFNGIQKIEEITHVVENF
jgi:8-oxo-dGTP pyrophosphatase MutT (NUDIX family)